MFTVFNKFNKLIKFNLLQSLKGDTMSMTVVIRRTKYGEWRMNKFGGAEETAYYASDIDDAIYTAFAEWGKDIQVHAPTNVLRRFREICKEKGYVCKDI